MGGKKKAKPVRLRRESFVKAEDLRIRSSLRKTNWAGSFFPKAALFEGLYALKALHHRALSSSSALTF
jgi:hypothetical protein